MFILEPPVIYNTIFDKLKNIKDYEFIIITILVLIIVLIIFIVPFIKAYIKKNK